MANSKTKKIIISLGVMGTIAAAAATAITLGVMNNDIFGQFNDTPQLSQVSNIEYDNKNFVLSWDEVENADSYNVSINGNQETVLENKVFYVPTSQSTEFKVQALDSTGEYKNSEWSNAITYTIPQNEVSYASVNAFVSTMLPSDYKLIKLVNISVDSNENKVYTNAVFERNSELKVYELSTNYDFDINSLSDVVNDNAAYTRILNRYDIANYDSANSLLKSNSYVGQMEELRQQGYTFEVVSQQVGKWSEDNSEFKLFSIFKASNEKDVKYINSTLQVGVPNTSPIEKTNYTTRVENPEDRILYEEYFKILSGDEIDVAKDMEEANLPLTFTFEGENSGGYTNASGQGAYNPYSSDDFCL